MAANTSPIFTLTPVIGMAQISTANTNLDGTGTLVTIITGAVDGTRINRITVKGLGTTTAGIVRLFIDDGANIRLWKEILITAITPSGTVAAFSDIINLYDENALVLPKDYVLKAAPHNAESFAVIAEGGEF